MCQWMLYTQLSPERSYECPYLVKPHTQVSPILAK